MRLFVPTGIVNKPIKRKANFEENYFHNILRLFDALTNLPFTTHCVKHS